MTNSFDVINRIYNKLADSLSKEIFKNRLLFLATNEWEYIDKLVNCNYKASQIRKKMSSVRMPVVLFGGGYRAKQLMQLNTNMRWYCIVDNNPVNEKIMGIDVVNADGFLKKYSGETIIIGSRIYAQDMLNQLQTYGVQKDKIINYGGMLQELWEDQYFDLADLMYENEEIFVDVGAFDGETTKNLFSRIGDNLKKAYLFEPSADNISNIKMRMKNLGIEYTLIDKGAYDEETRLFFKEQGPISCCESRKSNDIDESVKVTSIDKILNGNRVTFIKMDIEGCELKALHGAEKTIKQFKPKLAICVYHKNDDIIEIPNYLLSLVSDYKFYLRHYSVSNAETVLYAIP